MRKEFSRKTKGVIHERANGHCEACGAVLKKREGQYDHILPDALSGLNSPANGQLICVVCHKEKTKEDTKKIRKADRQRDKNNNTMKTKQTIKSKGFPKTRKKSRFEKKPLPARQLFRSADHD